VFGGKLEHVVVDVLVVGNPLSVGLSLSLSNSLSFGSSIGLSPLWVWPVSHLSGSWWSGASNESVTQVNVFGSKLVDIVVNVLVWSNILSLGEVLSPDSVLLIIIGGTFLSVESGSLGSEVEDVVSRVGGSSVGLWNKSVDLLWLDVGIELNVVDLLWVSEDVVILVSNGNRSISSVANVSEETLSVEILVVVPSSPVLLDPDGRDVCEEASDSERLHF